MNAWIEVVNFALLNYIKNSFWVLVAVFAAILAATIAFAIYEIKNDIS